MSRARHKRAESQTISTVIITAALLTILGVSSSFSIDMLQIQMQNSEMDQAKTVMMLLEKTVMDVSLRPGAASTVRFFQRSGGIGLYDGEDIEIKVTRGNEVLWEKRERLVDIRYRGGRLASAAEMMLSGTDDLIVDVFKPLGRLRVVSQGGVWITLDYDRVRVSVNEELGTMDVYRVKLIRGVTYGSGTVSVKVHNKGVNVTVVKLDVPSQDLQVRVRLGDKIEYFPAEPFDFPIKTVRIVEVVIEVSITGG